MFIIEIPSTLQQIFAIFYQLKMWTRDDERSLFERGRKIFYYLYLVGFIMSIGLGAYVTDNSHERIFLLVPAIAGVVLIHKLWFILWKQNEILVLVHEIGTHSTNDQEEFFRIDKKLQMLMKFVRYFLFMLFCGTIFIVILFPLAREERLFFNIAFPLNRSESEIVTWLAYTFTSGGTIVAGQFRELGTIKVGSESVRKVSTVSQQLLYAKDLLVAIRNFDEINGKLEEFTSIYANLFFLQIATSSLCICGSVYSLAFSSHEDLIQDGMYCMFLVYCYFDIFVVMYLGNEIKLLSGQLLYCLFESNWIEQTQSCKLCILILGERFKQSQEITVGKIYPLNLETFGSIVNGAYSMFNILQNFRK